MRRFILGTASVDPKNGENRFSPSTEGVHSYVVKKMPDEYYKNQINELIK